MDQDRENLIDYRLNALRKRGDKLEDLESLMGTSGAQVRQRVGRYDDAMEGQSSLVDDDPRVALSDALAWGDEEAFTSVIAENSALFRWINPAALNGAEELRSFHSEQIAQVTADEHGKPSMVECVTVVLPNHPSPMASIELLQAIIPRSKRLVIISTRTALRTLLADPF